MNNKTEDITVATHTESVGVSPACTDIAISLRIKFTLGNVMCYLCVVTEHRRTSQVLG